MKESIGACAIAELAVREGVSVEDIRRELQFIIDAGLTLLSPRARAYWSNLINNGVAPTPENLIVYMAEYIKKAT